MGRFTIKVLIVVAVVATALTLLASVLTVEVEVGPIRVITPTPTAARR